MKYSLTKKTLKSLFSNNLLTCDPYRRISFCQIGNSLRCVHGDVYLNFRDLRLPVLSEDVPLYIRQLI